MSEIDRREFIAGATGVVVSAAAPAALAVSSLEIMGAPLSHKYITRFVTVYGLDEHGKEVPPEVVEISTPIAIKPQYRMKIAYLESHGLPLSG